MFRSEWSWALEFALWSVTMAAWAVVIANVAPLAVSVGWWLKWGTVATAAAASVVCGALSVKCIRDARAMREKVGR